MHNLIIKKSAEKNQNGMAKKALMLLAISFFCVNLAGCDKIEKFNPFAKKGNSSAVKGEALAQVNDWKLSVDEFSRRLDIMRKVFNIEVDSREDKMAVLNELIQREILSQEAQRKGIDKKREIREAVEDFRKGLLVTEIASQLIGKVEVPPEEIEKYYEDYKEAFEHAPELKVREIVVASEDEAKSILIELLGGKYSFSLAAEEYSISDSAKDRGDIGYVKKGSMFPKFDEIAFSLDRGSISSVFKGPKGYYIIRVEDVKEVGATALSEVYDDIRNFLKNQKQSQALQQLVNQLKEKADIKIREDLLP